MYFLMNSQQVEFILFLVLWQTFLAANFCCFDGQLSAGWSQKGSYFNFL